MFLRQSTASQEIELGAFLDVTDGDTIKTGLTIANTDIKLWKNGTTSLANKNSGGATHMAGGMYSAVLDDTDTDTLGQLEVHVHVATALYVMRRYFVLAQNVYDAWIGSVKQDVNTFSITANAITATAIQDNAITANKIATGAIDADAIAADAITAAKIATDAIDADAIAASAVTEIQSGAATANAIAETLLKYDLSTISGEAARSLIQAIRAQINRWTVTGGVTYNVYKEDGTTIAFTRTLVRTAGNPVSSSTP